MKQLKALAETPIIGGLVKKAMSTMASQEAQTISEHFSMYLKPHIARTELQKQDVYRLRHQVYCEELQFEEIKDGYIETDEFDQRSIHCYIRHLSSTQLAGTVRLITSADTNELLPLEQFCLHAVTNETLHPRNFRRDEVCEMSRLAVPATFRKRQVDKKREIATGAFDIENYSETELRCFPFIAVSLYMSAAAMSYKTKRYHVFVMMEPRLARSLNYVGINFIQLGEPIEYHGQRAPYYIDSRTLKHTMAPGYVKLLEIIEAELYSDEKAGDVQSGSNRVVQSVSGDGFFALSPLPV